MINSLFSARFLLPFLLASPMFVLGRYGLSLGELLVIVAGVYFLVVSRRPSVKIPRFLLVFISLYAIGWLTALIGATNFGIPVDASRLNFLYLAAVPILAYTVGRYSPTDVESAATAGPALVIVCAVGSFAAAYPLLSPEVRRLILDVFNTDIESSIFDALRFPGIGINANVYSYLVLMIFLFSYNAYLKGRAAAYIPLFALITIFAAAGRLVAALSLLSCATLWIDNYISNRKLRAPRRRRGPFTFKAKTVYVGVGLVCAVALAGYFAEELEKLSDVYILLTRIEQTLNDKDLVLSGGVYSQADAFELGSRTRNWKLGFDRISLAPFSGIAKHPTIDSNTPLYFTFPHNEFIYFWSVYGLSGLIAHVYLVAYLIILNVRKKSPLPWVLLYCTLPVQMFFDGAFQYIRFISMFFIVVGLNMRYLKMRSQSETETGTQQ